MEQHDGPKDLPYLNRKFWHYYLRGIHHVKRFVENRANKIVWALWTHHADMQYKHPPTTRAERHAHTQAWLDRGIKS